MHKYCTPAPHGSESGFCNGDLSGSTSARESMSTSRESLPLTSMAGDRRWSRGCRKVKRINRWGSDVWTRIAIASAFTLFLQWGTTMAAVIIVVRFLRLIRTAINLLFSLVVHPNPWIWYVTDVILRSTDRVITQGVAPVLTLFTLSWPPWFGSSWSFLLSLPTTRISPTKTRNISNFTKWQTKQLPVSPSSSVVSENPWPSFLNTAWILAVCLMQFSGFFHRGYCGSSVLSLGRKAYFILQLTPEYMGPLRDTWICGTFFLRDVSWLYVD